MSKIDDLIKELCPNGVEWKKLGDFCKISTGKGITKKDEVIGGVYPIISGGITPMGYYDLYNREANTITISRVGANAGFVNLIENRFYLNDKCFSVIPNEISVLCVNVFFLYYYLKYKEKNISELQSEGGVPTINTQKLSNIEIPLPPLPIQQEIVRILDKFVEQQEQLEQLIELRKKQYEYYREELLTPKEGEEWETKALGEVCEIKGRIGFRGYTRDDQVKQGEGCLALTASNITKEFHICYGDDTYITWDKYFESPEIMVNEGDVILCQRGSIGKLAYVDSLIEKSTINPQLLLLKDFKCDSKYVFYYMTSKVFQDSLERIIGHGTVQMVAQKDVNKLTVKYPRKTKHLNDIVEKLDCFESSIADLSSALESSKARYAHYRDQLLNFKTA